MQDEYFEMLKKLAKLNPVKESVVGNTTATLPYVPTVAKSDVCNPVIFPEHSLFPYNTSIDEDVIENYNNLEATLRSPRLSTQEAFDLVYKIFVDDDVDLDDDNKSLKLVGIVLDRFFEDLSIDNISVIDKPYELFFVIYKYFFVTYSIEKLSLAILMMFIVQHKDYKSIYLEPFKYLTLNNDKSINALLSAFRYVPTSEFIQVSKDESFHKYFIKFLKSLVKEHDVLRYIGIEQKDYEVLLPYLIEDDNTIDSIYRNILNLNIGEFCKYSCIAMLTGVMENGTTRS